MKTARADVNSTALPVGRESLDDVGAGMPGEPRRHAALGRDDVDVGVAVVLRAERDRSVGRERRIRFQAVVGRQPPDGAAVQARRPEVSGVDERDLLAVGRGLRKEARIRDVDCCSGAWCGASGERYRGGQRKIVRAAIGMMGFMAGGGYQTACFVEGAPVLGVTP